MDLGQLRSAEPEPVFSAAARLGRVSDGLKDAAERVRTTVRDQLDDDAWHGAASVVALARIDRLGEELARSGDVVAQVGGQVRAFGDALAEAKTLVARAEGMAGGARLTIGADGSVTVPKARTEAEAQSLQATGDEVHRMLGTAVTMASAADRACADALATAAGVGEPAGIAAASSLLAVAGAVNGGSGDGDGSGGDGPGFDIGNMDHLEAIAFEHVFGAPPDDLLGAGVVDTISEEGVLAGVDAWWDQSWEDMTTRPDLGDLFGPDPDGGVDIGNMDRVEAIAFEHVFGAPEDDLLGAGVVDTISEEGVLAGAEEWWDQSWEDMAEVPDRISERWDGFTDGVENFADDPIGTIGGMFR